MGNTSSSIKKINFEDMQCLIRNNNIIIINTLDEKMQVCLITNTTDAHEETTILNNLLKKNTENIIVIYGMNACDEKIVSKYNQLVKLGFCNVLIYPGGMFEWLLLQDIYGEDSFPTTGKEYDILRYKGKCLTKKNI
jgi:hypothetical protein